MEKNIKEKVIMSILIIIIIGSLIGIIYFGVNSYNNVKDNKDIKNPNLFDRLFTYLLEEKESPLDNFKETNLEFFYKGINPGFKAKEAIDEIIDLNNKGYKLIVIYNDKEYKEDDILLIKSLLDEYYSYNISFEYNKKKIEKVIIKREITKDEVTKFNAVFVTLYSGVNSGFHIKSFLNHIISSNQVNENKIIVNFNNKDYITNDEIVSIIPKLETNTDYNIIYEFDEYGFVNKAILKKVM